MIFLVVESLTWPEIWMVTGLGFGIVLLLLFFLIYVLQFFGWIMQKATAPKAPKTEPKEETIANSQQPTANAAPSEPEKAAIAMSLAQAGDEDIAAIAYALYLARDSKHDIPTAMIHAQARETAWNTKSIGLNNIGF